MTSTTCVSLIARRNALRITVAIPVLIAGGAKASQLPTVVVWKDPSCGCCGRWISHIRQSGFEVSLSETSGMPAIKAGLGVPKALQSCHTATVGGYVIEGHVPADDIIRLIKERPPVKGLAVPGMPQSAPGMDQPGQRYTVLKFGDIGGNGVFAEH
jgi:hypothetical protein